MTPLHRIFEYKYLWMRTYTATIEAHMCLDAHKHAHIGRSTAAPKTRVCVCKRFG